MPAKKTTMLLALLSLTLSTPALANLHELFIQSMSQALATQLECEQSHSSCLPTSEPLVVEGVVLPSDALQDPSRQRPYLASRHYLRSDGTLFPLPRSVKP